MAEPNEVYDTIMRELNDLVLSDTDESKEQQSFSFHEEAGFDDIPPSLLSYFETSKSRAAVCEKLILEDLEDFTASHHPEDMTNLSIGLDKVMMKLNEQAICDPEKEENDISSDTRLLASTETETLSDRLCTHNMSLCSNNEDEAGTNMESEEHLLFETRTVGTSLNGEERKKMSEYEEQRKKQQYEEMKMEEHKRQIERDFQEELRKIKEAEKLHQKEIELMEKRAQERLEQEFLLQQELISNLQRRVKEERRMKEEEQNRMKRKREEEKVKMEAERKRQEEERRIREEELRRMKEEEDKKKREEEKVKMEAERKRKEEERSMMEEEDRRKREEEKVKMEAERKKQEEGRRIREEELRRMKEEEDKKKREEEKVKMEAEAKRKEEERSMMEEEDKRKREEAKVKMEAERKRQEEERRIREEELRRMKEEEDKRKREEAKVKMEAERKRKEEERSMMEEEDRRKREEAKVKMEAERKKQEEGRRIREEELRRMKEEEDEKKREEGKVKMEAERKRKEEETRRKKEEEIIIEEMKLKKEEEERRKLENEVRMMQEEQKKERAEEVERKKREEEEKREEKEQNKIKEARKEMEKMETESKMMIEIRLKKEDDCRKRKERKDKEGRVTEEIEERKKQDGVTEKKKEADDRKKMAQEKMDVENWDKNGNIDEEVKLERKKTQEMYRKRLEEEKDRKSMEKEKDSKEVVRNQEGENRKIKEERRPIVEDEKKNTDEMKAGEEERGRRQTEKMRRPRDEDNYRKSKEDMRLKEENDLDNRKMEHESKPKDEQNKQEEEKRKRDEGRKNIEPEKEQNGENIEENKEEVNKTMGEEMRIKEKEKSKNRMMPVWGKEVKVVKAHELQEKREEHSMKGHNEKKHIDERENSSQREDSTSWSSSSLESIICPDGTEAILQQQDLDKKISQTSARLSTGSVSLPVSLPEHTEQRRLSWMKDCIPWSKLSLQNRRKQKGSVHSRRGLRRAAEASSLPPLCSESLLQSTGWKSLQEVTTVTLEDLPGCSLSTLGQCTQLRSLSLRRCGLKSLEGINHLPQLCYIDVQENDISFINCENMSCLRVLKLGHNKLTSIHGLAGAENLDVLQLSHNSITRIAGLESVRRLQRLSVDNNHLISTKGLRDVYTLLHLNCSHNHLASVGGLENSALLNTLDLRANSLTEPPSLNNQVLLRELHLDDNSISSLQSLTACWLPLLQHLSVAQNRITQLPSVSDFVSLENLDLQFNCMSELQNVCESLEGCHLLQKVHLTGNPLQQESGWRSTLQKAVSGLRVIDDQWTDSSLSLPAAQQVTLASGSFLTFCQAQLQQTRDLQQQHSRELSKASSSLDAVKISCHHFTEALQLAADQRFAHEYGDTNVADKHRAAGQTIPEETVDMGIGNADKHSECPEIESTEKVPPVIPISDNIGYSTAAESRHDTFDTDTTRPQTGPAVGKVNYGSVNYLMTKRKTNSTNLKMAPVFNRQDLDRQIAAAVVIQQLWRKYRQKCGNISSPSTAEKRGGRGGDGVKPGPGPSYINGSVVGQDHAATVIQAFWRGFTLRRRLASALAAVTCADSGEDDTFEEVDMDEFDFDEAALEKHWTLPLREDSSLSRYPVSEQPLSLKPLLPFPETSQYILPPPVERKSKQAWVASEQVESKRQGVSPLSSNRSKSPASTSAVSGLSKRSEKILEEWGFTNHHTALLMLKRAQNFRKSKKHQQKRRQEPSVRLALFRNCGFQPDPVEAWNRKARHSSNDIKVRDVELGLQQAEKTERVKQDQARQWLHNQAAHSDRDSESVRFLPEISSDILNGGRVQLVADPGYTERLHHASGLWANSSLTAQPCRENNYPRRNSLGHAREEVPSPRVATSAPSIKERISFRDNPVQLSSGWGGGKKRGKVCK